VNKDKSETLELEIKSNSTCIPVKASVNITSLHFGLDKEAMQKLNWEEAYTKVRKLLKSWHQRYLTMTGKGNIIRSQIMPIITFAGSSTTLPKDYEKKFNSEIFTFLWGGSEKERRSLCHKS
jgi:hypothetical protein